MFKIKKIVFPLVLIIGFCFISCGNNENDLPEKLGDLSLSKTIKSNDATKIVNKMHGKRIETIMNLIGYYGNGQSRNILYVSVYQNAEKAKNDLMKMATKMAKGTQVFAPLTLGKMGDNVRFQTEGMGFKHYFYRVDSILIWWQVKPDKAESTYNDLLDFDFATLKEVTKKKQ